MINQPGQLSPDGTTYWNGTAWLSTLAPDSQTRWNGTAWAPVAPPVKRGHKVRNAGIVVGIGVVIYLTFVDPTRFKTFNVGLIGLAANLVVLAAGAVVERAVTGARAAQEDRPRTQGSAVPDLEL